MEGWAAERTVLVSHPPLVHHDYLLGSQRRDRNKQAAAAAICGSVRTTLYPTVGIPFHTPLIQHTTRRILNAPSRRRYGDGFGATLRRFCVQKIAFD